MKLFVGVADSDWFRYLRDHQSDEMNFWRLRSTNRFKVLEPGELFLFKSKYPDNTIVGGAFFVRHTVLTDDLAWKAFGLANGADSLGSLRQMIQRHRRDKDSNPMIGCTILAQPFCLDGEDSLDPPNDLSANIVSGKSYETFPNSEGLRLFEQAQAVFSGTFPHFNDKSKLPLDERFGKPQFISPRLGQGWFGIMVINEYDRKCAITGEKNLPVLETAHIKPYSENGPHKVCNGIFMRYGLHALFDGGYMTLSNEFHVEVSRRIREEFSNGREYSAPHGEKLLTLPEKEAHRPSLEHLEWYQSNCYLGWK